MIVLALGQYVYVRRFVFRMQTGGSLNQWNGGHCPPANVVMCVRGKDPHLESCLESLLAQDYPEHQIHIVVDHESDPSLPLIQKYCESFAHAQLHVLSERLPTCSLKCSGLAQVLTKLPKEGIVAFLDSDTLPGKHWLRSLALGFEAPNVGAITGIRWYEPTKQNLGTIVRYVWNAAAIVQMVVYRIAWGGTLAIDHRTIESTGLLDKWRQSFCEDTMLNEVLRANGQTIEFRSDLIIVSRESCDLSSFSPWLTRQLLTARLYHPAWWFVAIHAMATTAAILLSLLLFVYALAAGDNLAAIALGSVSVLYQLTNAWLLRMIVCTIHNQLDNQKVQTVVPLHWLVLAAVVAQTMYCYSVFRAMTLSQVAWRGVNYTVNGPWDIRMDDYHPFQSHNSSTSDSL